mmetsp:Transcript_20962/g.56400  ORF Transcript_20962/g.56400 Transcript_20962/m.56400 type:complete len:96 (-) Transcript_20962:611-898(-)
MPMSTRVPPLDVLAMRRRDAPPLGGVAQHAPSRHSTAAPSLVHTPRAERPLLQRHGPSRRLFTPTARASPPSSHATADLSPASSTPASPLHAPCS